MKQWDTVAILGVGLIGGSIGLALRHRNLARQVIGIGRNSATLKIAAERGAVTSTTTDLTRGVAEADLTVVCTPVGEIVGHVRQVAAACPERALITDVGSIKTEIVNSLCDLPRGVRFVGSHPLAGGEKSGPGVADEALLENRTVIVTPAPGTVPADRQIIVDFWSSLGAKVMTDTAEHHDEVLAVTSHLPHLVASALAMSTPVDALPLTATGWADTTRIAAGDPELWQQILLGNRQSLLAALGKFENTLGELRAAIVQDDVAKLRECLTEGKRHRDAVGN